MNDDTAWMARPDLACKTHPALADLTRPEITAIFYPERGGSTWLPKAICQDCPAIEACAEWGVAHEHHGIFGGLSERQRRILRRERGVTARSPEVIAALSNCGTEAGFRRHHRAGESPCRRCLDANSRAQEFRRPSRAKAAS